MINSIIFADDQTANQANGDENKPATRPGTKTNGN